MGWLIFFCYLIYGIMVNLFMRAEDEAPAGSVEYKRLHLVVTILIIFGIASLAIFALYCLGWVWYFFCGGFLVFEDQPFLDKVVCGLISLIPLGIFLGFLAIIGGWDPTKK